MKDIVTDIMTCDCHSTEHQIVINFDEDTKENLVYLHIHLVTHRNFFKRLWLGLKYVFGYKSRYGNWDEFIVSRKNYHKLKDVVNFIEKREI